MYRFRYTTYPKSVIPNVLILLYHLFFLGCVADGICSLLGDRLMKSSKLQTTSIKVLKRHTKKVHQAFA